MKNKILSFSIFFLFGWLILSCSNSKSVVSNWEGKLIYTLNAKEFSPDANDSIHYQIVYAKDSLLRIDSYTSMGKQVYLSNLSLNTKYILVNIGTTKIAIKMPSDTIKSHEDNNGYRLKRKSGKKLIGGLLSKNLSVRDTILDTTIVMNYYPKIPAKYSTAFDNFPGLPTNYFIYTKGIWINYRLQSIQAKPMKDSLFMVPNDYKIMSLDDFMKLIRGHSNG